MFDRELLRIYSWHNPSEYITAGTLPFVFPFLLTIEHGYELYQGLFIILIFFLCKLFCNKVLSVGAALF